MYAIKLKSRTSSTHSKTALQPYLSVCNLFMDFFRFLKFIVSIYLHKVGFLKDLIVVESIAKCHNIFQALIVRGKCKKS